MTRSPTLTSIGMRCPSSNRPGPTAMTSPSWGRSLAVSGMTRPEAVVSSSSSGCTAMRSSSGVTPNVFPMLSRPSRTPDVSPGGQATAGLLKRQQVEVRQPAELVHPRRHDHAAHRLALAALLEDRQSLTDEREPMLELRLHRLLLSWVAS